MVAPQRLQGWRSRPYTQYPGRRARGPRVVRRPGPRFSPRRRLASLTVLAKVRNFSYRQGRVYAGQVARLAPVDVADACKLPLVQQRKSHGDVRFGAKPAQSFFLVPVRTEQVRPEVPNNLVFLSGGHHFQDAEREPDGVGGVRAEHTPCSVAGFRPAAPGG